MISKRGERKSMCGGTVVGTNAVITAAHCVFDMEHRDDLYVRLGANANDGLKHSYVKEYQIKKVSFFSSSCSQCYESEQSLKKVSESVTSSYNCTYL